MKTDPIECPLCDGSGEWRREIPHRSGRRELSMFITADCPFCKGGGSIDVADAFPVRPALRTFIESAITAFFDLPADGLKCPKCRGGRRALRVFADESGGVHLKCDRCSWESKGKSL